MVLTANLCINAQQRQQVTQSEALTVAQRLLISSGNRTQNLIHKKPQFPKKSVYLHYTNRTRLPNTPSENITKQAVKHKATRQSRHQNTPNHPSP